MELLKSDFYYDLPKELIAQTPLERRDSSRLLVLDRQDGHIEHKHFFDLPQYLRRGDCLVMNDTRVFPARLIGSRETGSAAVELLLLRRRSLDIWETLVRPGKKLRTGSRAVFGDGELTAEILDVLDGGNRLVKFYYDGVFEEILDRLGKMPLPPYITQKLDDPSRYNTVYAKDLGSAAAPTAGLHFTRSLIDNIREMGVSTAYVTLHVGLGTFRPVKTDKLSDHHMHSERYFISQDAARLINQTKEGGGRIICVGTTSCRTIESAAGEDGRLAATQTENSDGWRETDIFIYPGYKFKITNCLITNFHLPESTLIMLVSALSGRERTLDAYKEAVRQRYRFFSFGDAMMVL